jgi:hypothetical protein
MTASERTKPTLAGVLAPYLSIMNRFRARSLVRNFNEPAIYALVGVQLIKTDVDQSEFGARTLLQSLAAASGEAGRSTSIGMAIETDGLSFVALCEDERITWTLRRLASR